MVSKSHGASLNENDKSEGIVFLRPKSSYASYCNKFMIKDRTFDRQYASFYITRLKITTRNLKEISARKWGPGVPIKQLCNIEGNETCIVIGTLYKHMELHPSILKEISEEHNLVAQPVCEEFTEENDYLILEDDLQRVVLCGNIDPQYHVTGINIAVYGYTEDRGRFFVEDFCYSSASEPVSLPLFEEDKYILLVSGIGLGDPEVLFPLQLFTDFFNGCLGDEQDQEKYSKVVRIIIAGNSIGQVAKDSLSKAKILTRKSKATTVENIKVLDDFLSQLVSSVDVDIMPGEFDPANHLLPQQPLHPCMFPKSSAYSTFHVVTNPYEAVIDGVRFLGTAGQNLKDIRSYSKLSDSIEILERTLDWSHLCPTAPDTLNCYPFLDEDPFILSEYPHVYFAGNMPNFGVRRYKNKTKTLMICVPKFQNTFSAVLLNLKSFVVEPVTFNVQLS